MASLNTTPSAERVHIGLFGKRNAGKSSLVNALTSQEVSVVSDTPGTTTDPVAKAMELLPLGPVLIIDTPGIDDEGELGELRVKRTLRTLNNTDIALIVVDAGLGIGECERELEEMIRKKGIPYITVLNKSDLCENAPVGEGQIAVSAKTGEGIIKLREILGSLKSAADVSLRIIGDRINKGDTVVLVTPIDESAPKGRLILPQVQTARDILDSMASVVLTQPDTLSSVLENMKRPPALVITDSQVFKEVDSLVPEDISLTSFSILMAAYKGVLDGAVRGVTAIDRLKKGDRVLISEGCTHHRQCGDIGTVKLPALLRKYTGAELEFHFTSGRDFSDELDSYSLVIHCGGCMLSEREMNYRSKCAADAGIPFTNYGTALAYMNGILKRSLKVFPELYGIVNK